MRPLLFGICVLAATPIRADHDRALTKPDGVYISIQPVEGKAMVGDNRIDTVLMIEGTPMKQYVGVERIEEVFDVDALGVAVLAESHGGEAIVSVEVLKNGRQTVWKSAQGRQVVLHYNPWGEQYVAVFPRR
jgi:hypothetical protein